MRRWRQKSNTAHALPLTSCSQFSGETSKVITAEAQGTQLRQGILPEALGRRLAEEVIIVPAMRASGREQRKRQLQEEGPAFAKAH